MFRWGQSKVFWNGSRAFMCDSNHFGVSAYQQLVSPCSASCFDDKIANLEYLHVGSSQKSWILVIDQNNASTTNGANPIFALREKERYINDVWRLKLSNEANHDYKNDQLLLSSYP